MQFETDVDSMARVPSLQSKVEEMAYRAMVADELKGLGKIVDSSRVNAVSARELVDAGSGDIIAQVVIPGELKDIIVYLHNQLRAGVKPPATDMQTMVRSPVDSGIRQ